MRKSVDDVGWEILSEILRENCLRRDDKSGRAKTSWYKNNLILNLYLAFNTWTDRLEVWNNWWWFGISHGVKEFSCQNNKNVKWSLQ